jgi:hypothetical protein
VTTVGRNTGRSAGFSLIVGATILAGLAGYAVTLLVYREVGAAAYAEFAVFWAALYLLVGGLSGIQQEVTRATRRIEPGERSGPSRARNFAVIAAVIVLGIIVGSSPLWQQAVFPDTGWPLVAPLAVGAASYVLVAVLGGSLFGISRWRVIAAMVAIDGVLRLALVAVGLVISHDLTLIAWFVALPFPLTILIVWPLIRRGFVQRTEVDVGYRALTWNAMRTVVAAVATGVLVSGFPLLLGVTSIGEPAGFVGELLFTITIVRAPLIVAVMSLQGYFVVRFRDETGRGRLFGVVAAFVVASGVVLALLAWWLGPALLAWATGTPTTLDGRLLGLLVLSSALVALLVLSGAAVLARARHYGYSAGWLVAAFVTIVIMVLPVDLVVRAPLALILGPLAGLATHLVWIPLSAARSGT